MEGAGTGEGRAGERRVGSAKKELWGREAVKGERMRKEDGPGFESHCLLLHCLPASSSLV